jgi:isoquinoline 1-oxidoreductase beta subunit
MADKLDLKDRPRRTFQSLRVLEERGLFGGLTEIRNLTGHMTRRGVVKGFLAGFGGLTLGCDADGTKAGHTGSRDDTATSGYDSEGRDTGGRHTGGYDSEGRDTGGSDTAGDTGGADTGLAEEAPSWPVSIWLNISEDGKVTVVVVKNEMGQGIATACAMIVAEELDVDWEVVDVVLAAELDDYDLPSFSNGTWGSLSIPYNYQDWREIGGAARQMVLQAAALRWGVSTESLTTASGVVYHEEKGELPYGELAEEASALPVPTSFTLKDPSEFRIIGQPAQRVDIRDHIEGKTVYGIDVKVDGMRYAAVMQSPVFGGEVANLSELSVKGTGADQLVAIPNGVAVVASSWWSSYPPARRWPT